MNEDRASRFIWEAGDVELVTNKDMQCAGCKFVINGNATECEKYDVKPRPVMDNEKPCSQFISAG